MSDHRLRGAERNIDLELDCSTRLTAWGDPVRVRQVMTNLLDNALHFTPDGGTISVRLAAAGHAVEVSVANDGPGIRPENLERVFDQFFQEDRAPECRARSGLGLGLYVCRKLLSLMGGSIVAESGATGTTIVFALPIEAVR